MAKKVKPCPGWLATFADLMSLLMALFVLLFALSSVDENKYEALVKSLSLALAGGEDLTKKQFEFFDAIKQATDDDKKGQTTIDNLKPLYESLLDTFAQSEANNEVKINYDPDKNQIKVSFAEEISFSSGRADLKPNIIFQLRKMKVFMRDDLLVRAVGHTDSIPILGGPYPSNWALSSVRAAAVVDRLVKERIALPEQLESIGLADTQPISKEDTPEGRAVNRRVEIILMPIGDRN